MALSFPPRTGDLREKQLWPVLYINQMGMRTILHRKDCHCLHGRVIRVLRRASWRRSCWHCLISEIDESMKVGEATTVYPFIPLFLATPSAALSIAIWRRCCCCKIPTRCLIFKLLGCPAGEGKKKKRNMQMPVQPLHLTVKILPPTKAGVSSADN